MYLQGGAHPYRRSIEDGAHALKPIAMLLIGGSPPLLARGFRRHSLRVARQCGRIGALLRPSCPPISGTICATQTCPGAPNSAWAQIAASALYPSTSNLLLLRTSGFEPPNADIVQHGLPSCGIRAPVGLGACTQRRRQRESEIRAACSAAWVRVRTRAPAPLCARSHPGAVRDAEVRGRGCDRPGDAVIFSRHVAEGRGGRGQSPR